MGIFPFSQRFGFNDFLSSLFSSFFFFQVRLLDIIQASPGGLYLVFEFVAHDLKTYMDQFQSSDDISERVGLPLSTVRSFLRQIIAGVGCCHTYRILHRDLKPHNVRYFSKHNIQTNNISF